MGSCFSTSTNISISTRRRPPTAKVINIDGKLTEYSLPVKVSQILGPNQSSCFLCNADSIFYGQFIQALGSDRVVQQTQLFFVLPAVKLDRRLVVADLVELAVRASSAFAAAASTNGEECGRRRRRRVVVEVSQVVETMDFDCYERIGDEFGFGLEEIEVFKR